MRNALLLTSLLLVGCTGDDTDTAPIDTIEPVCDAPKTVECEDDLILSLSLHDDKVSDGAVNTTADGDSYITTAGGFQDFSNNPWVYVKFTPAGAERVDIDDETALESMDWHIAARRFILRLNGGSSGASCVAAAPFLEKTYDELATVPDGVRYVEDDFTQADCTVINDSSGLPNSPQVALGAWWEYPGCVKTTGVPFLIRLDDGRQLRFEVLSSYQSEQEVCNSTGSGGVGGANFTWKWSFVE